MRMRYESFDAGAAFRCVEDRVASSLAYRELEAKVRRYAVEGWLACNSVAEFKAVGGRSAVFAAAMERACSEVERANENMGSPMFPLTPAKVLGLRRHSLEAECRLEEGRRRAARKEA